MLRSNVLAAKARLAKGYEDFKARHRAGCRGTELCALLTNLRDAVLLELIEAALADLGEGGPKGLAADIAIVAHGGYGRRDVAPFSDVDLMILHRPGVEPGLTRLAERLLRDVFDVGLMLGHSVRTPRQACSLALSDSVICTSLVDSRLLYGNGPLLDRFMHMFRRTVGFRAGRIMAAVQESRTEERLRYGETVYLLEPNLKRSQGTLRDLQLLRWIGFVRYGLREPRGLCERGLLSPEDLAALEHAYEFLLRLRNDLHFHAGGANDVLSRAEQLRLAEQMGYEAASGMLPVERFMQDYFRHTSAVSHIVSQFVSKATSRDRLNKAMTWMFGRRVEDDLYVGPGGMVATRRAQGRMRGSLPQIMRLADLSNLHDVPIAPSTWEFIRSEAARLPEGLTPEATRRFRSLLGHPGRMGNLVRGMHDIGLLERFLPEFARARGLLQFNQYHKYTVDEHCLRAMEFAERLLSDLGPVGRVYRGIADKHILHLALLVHDLGKGQLEDHREVGLRIAQQTAERLGLSAHETETLKFLVHKHLRMNHLAFRRDTSDEELVVRFAVQVGSPEWLQMLYVMTAADLGAVGPGVWDGWKCDVITDLYHRAMQQLAGDSPATTVDALFDQRRQQIREGLGAAGKDPWFARHVDVLPQGYLSATPPAEAVSDLWLLHDLPQGDVAARAQYLADSATVQFTIGASEAIVPGIFHRLTGALTSHGLEIRSAQIHTLADGLVLDRFLVRDPDFAGEPPPDRVAEITRALEHSLRSPSGQPPSFRRTWRAGADRKPLAPRPQTSVTIDNSTSDRWTIVDVFAFDRSGLLYAITRALFELDLSVARAKIGTYLDQVVDVFYVTDQQGRKISEQGRLEEIRSRLLGVIEEGERAG